MQRPLSTVWVVILVLTVAACGQSNNDPPQSSLGGTAGTINVGGQAHGGAGTGTSGGAGTGGSAAGGSPGSPSNGSEWVVAPNGSDTNPGTLSAPFATLERARDTVRLASAAGLTADVKVTVRAGTYFLKSALKLDERDGDATHTVTWAAYPGEQPVISGGKVLSGWTKDHGDVWKTSIPTDTFPVFGFRDLFVDGKRAVRARFEVRGDFATDSSTVLELREPLPPGISTFDGVEADLPGIWFSSRVQVASGAGSTVTLLTPNDGQGVASDWLENALAFVDQPGEWYLDTKDNAVYYQEEPGKDPNARTFVAGRLDQLLLVEGKPEKPVKNLVFSGLSFLHTTWQYDTAAGYNEKWAGAYGTDENKLRQLPLAVDVEIADGVRFEGCRVGHIGSSGIGFGRGVKNSKIVGCEVYDTAGNAIVDGYRGKVSADGTMPQDVVITASWFPADGTGVADLTPAWGAATLIPTDNVISDNHVHHAGQVYRGTVGIHQQFQHNPHVEYNEVHDVNYAGTTFEAYTGDSRAANVYSFNHVHDVMFLGNDGDFIYHSASLIGCEIQGNFAEGGGIYLDYNGSGNHVVGNVLDAFRINSPMQDMGDNTQMPSPAQAVAAAAATGPREPWRSQLAKAVEPPISDH